MCSSTRSPCSNGVSCLRTVSTHGQLNGPLSRIRSIEARCLVSSCTFARHPRMLSSSYQVYLRERAASTHLPSMDNDVFYNCTSPRLDPRCEYSLDTEKPKYSSLNKVVHAFSRKNDRLSSVTCDVHLQCERESPSRCLDWTDVCDDFVGCPNDQID
jgi:hypothetical protein